MIPFQLALELARALPGVSEKDHFGGDAFSANGRNFATFWRHEGKVNLRLSPEEQRRFMDEGGEAFVEIDNAWGRQGWTGVMLEQADREVFAQALEAAYRHSAVKSGTPGGGGGGKKKAVAKKKASVKSKPARKG